MHHYSTVTVAAHNQEVFIMDKIHDENFSSLLFIVAGLISW